MNAKAETTLAPTAQQIEKWISDERRLLLADPNLQINLEGQRLAPLEAADYVALNRVEQHLSECIERQERAQERIALFTRRLQLRALPTVRSLMRPLPSKQKHCVPKASD